MQCFMPQTMNSTFLIACIYQKNLYKGKKFLLFIPAKIRQLPLLFAMVYYCQNMDLEFYRAEEKYFGQQIAPLLQQPKQLTVVISGFPYDEGTKINGGRIGGSTSPMIFRKALEVHEIYSKASIPVLDSGDIDKEMELPRAHEELFYKNVSLLHNPNIVPFVIGGSNDQSYPNARSLIETYPSSRVAVINIDAHFDVRPLKQGKSHSGSPFRQMLQHPLFDKNHSIFVEFACKGASCSNEHFRYLQQKGCRVIWLEKDIRRHKPHPQSQYRTQAGQLMKELLDSLSQKVQHMFFSFDIDSVSAHFMPGVSAPSIAGGLTDQEAYELMDIAGRQKKVRIVDCSEFNPAVEYQRSAKLIVEIFYAFCMGAATRQN